MISFLGVYLSPVAQLRGDNLPGFHFSQPFSPHARCLSKYFFAYDLVGQKGVHRPEILAAQTKEGLPFRGLLVFQNVLDDRQGKKVMILKFFDQTDPLNVALVIVSDVSAAFAWFGKESFSDVIVNVSLDTRVRWTSSLIFNGRLPGNDSKEMKNSYSSSPLFKVFLKLRITVSEWKKFVNQNLIA